MIEKILLWIEMHFFKAVVLAIFALILLLCGIVYSAAHAADAKMSWTHPTQYTDSSPLAPENLKETRLQYGTCTTATTPTFGTMTGEKLVPAPANTATFTGIVAGTYCFRALTVDLQGRVSAWSVVVSKTLYEIKPKAPTTVVVQ